MTINLWYVNLKFIYSIEFGNKIIFNKIIIYIKYKRHIKRYDLTINYQKILNVKY